MVNLAPLLRAAPSENSRDAKAIISLTYGADYQDALLFDGSYVTIFGGI